MKKEQLLIKGAEKEIIEKLKNQKQRIMKQCKQQRK